MKLDQGRKQLILSGMTIVGTRMWSWPKKEPNSMTRLWMAQMMNLFPVWIQPSQQPRPAPVRPFQRERWKNQLLWLRPGSREGSKLLTLRSNIPLAIGKLTLAPQRALMSFSWSWSLVKEGRRENMKRMLPQSRTVLAKPVDIHVVPTLPQKHG